MCHAAFVLVINTQIVVLAAIWSWYTCTTSNRDAAYRSWQLSRKPHHVINWRGTPKVPFVAPQPRVSCRRPVAGKKQPVTWSVQPMIVGKSRFVVADKGLVGYELFELRLQIDRDELAFWRRRRHRRARHRRRGREWWQGWWGRRRRRMWRWARWARWKRWLGWTCQLAQVASLDVARTTVGTVCTKRTRVKVGTIATVVTMLIVVVVDCFEARAGICLAAARV